MCVAPSSAALLYASFTADSARVSFVVIPPVQNPPPWPSTFPSDWHSPEGAAATPTILFPEAVRVVAAQPHSATADIIETILSMLYPLPTSRFSYNYGLQPGRVNFSRSSRRQHLRNATPCRSPGSTRRSLPATSAEAPSARRPPCSASPTTPEPPSGRERSTPTRNSSTSPSARTSPPCWS